MRMDGGYRDMLRAALDGAHVIDAAARRRAAAAEHAWLHAPAPEVDGAREAFRAAHAARTRTATEVAEIEGGFDFPELLDDPEEGFPELAD